MLVFHLILVLLILNIISALDPCGSRLTCKECIRDPSVCVWCAKFSSNIYTFFPPNPMWCEECTSIISQQRREDLLKPNESSVVFRAYLDKDIYLLLQKEGFSGPRCQTINVTIDKEWCPDGIQNPLNSKYILRNDNFTLRNDNVTLNPEHIIQIKPQMYTMTLRPGISEKFKFSFQAALDFPVDLYFLLDASLSMKDVKTTTAEQAQNIYDTIKKMTKSVRLGFGTFVDKAVLPFTITFEPTNYSFRHHLSLIESFTRFREVVSNATVSTNRDPQEGGLDALAQVIVCKEQIGWRNESRKIIVYLSNGPYHAAGDGKSAGIFQPYDGGCYTENGIYTKELEMDYPSPGMINKLAVERNMVILFFVQSNVEHIYSKLSTLIRDSKLSIFQNSSKTDASVVVRTLKDIYEQISNKISLNVRMRSGRRQNLEISFDPDCSSKKNSDDCNVQIGKEKTLMGTVKLLQYDDQKMHVDIGIESIQEKLSLEIEAIKSCECEASNKVENNSTFCNGEVKACGICVCGTKRYGLRCACKKNSADKFMGNSTCIPENSEVECNGHGSCLCGMCHCMKGFSGNFCDCNTESCPRDGQGKLCSGESHGKCLCGKCECQPQWTGIACECRKYENDATVCNNRGKWDCNACKCDELPDWDVRDYDKDCRIFTRPNTHQRQCRKLETCAICQRKQNEECTCNEKIQPKVVPILSNEYVNSSGWTLCPLKVAVGCYSNFSYRYDDKNSSLELVVEENKNCNESYGVFGALLFLTFIVGGVVIIMFWKFMIDARDRLECKQFLARQEQQGNFENPLYKQPSSNFTNPVFKRSFR